MSKRMQIYYIRGAEIKQRIQNASKCPKSVQNQSINITDLSQSAKIIYNITVSPQSLV
jgi:hypothetical protein